MRQALTGICLLLTSLATAGDFSANEHLWYTQPAGLPNTALPWAPRPHAAGNLPGKLDRDTWESQTLPVGNGRIGGTIYGGDRLDCVVLNETSLWTGGANAPENGANYEYGPKAGKDDFGSFQPFANLYIGYTYAEKTETTHYTRALDLQQAEAVTQFQRNGVQHRRSCCQNNSKLVNFQIHDLFLLYIRHLPAGIGSLLKNRLSILPGNFLPAKNNV